MEIPEGFANVRHVFSYTGRSRLMGWAHGVQPQIGVDAASIAALARTNFIESFIPSTGAMLAGWTYVSCDVTKTFAGNPEKFSIGPPVVGSGGAAGLVLNSCLLVTKWTGLGGRKNKGRAFIPPFNLPEGSVDQAGFVQTADITNQQAGYDNYFDKMVVDDLPLYLFHSDPADAATALIALFVQSQVATQRRRMR